MMAQTPNPQTPAFRNHGRLVRCNVILRNSGNHLQRLRSHNEPLLGLCSTQGCEALTSGVCYIGQVSLLSASVSSVAELRDYVCQMHPEILSNFKILNFKTSVWYIIWFLSSSLTQHLFT